MPLGATRAALLAPSGVKYAVGSFTKVNTLTNQAITGVGFKPKAILFWTAGSAAASGTWNADIFHSIGLTSGPTESYSVGAYSQDAVSSSNTQRGIHSRALVISGNGTDGTFFGQADLVSFDSDGFTLGWVDNDAGSADIQVMYLAIGGDITARAVNWTSPLAAGNQAVTGVGFQPDLVFHASTIHDVISNSTAHAQVHFGMMDASGGQGANNVFSQDALNPSRAHRYQRGDRATVWGDDAGVREESSYVSMDADGFTLNFTTAHAVAWKYVSLCLKGVKAKVGNFNKSTTVGNQTITGVGFKPKATLFSSQHALAGTTVLGHATWSLGAGDGTNQRLVVQGDEHSKSPTNAKALWRNTHVAVGTTSIGGGAVTDDHRASLASLDADGFTLNWTNNGAGAHQLLYLALG